MIRRHIVTLALVIVLTACSTGSRSTKGPTSAPSTGPVITVVALGGSATEGDGVRDRLRNAWPYLVFRTAFPRSTIFVNGALDEATLQHALDDTGPARRPSESRRGGSLARSRRRDGPHTDLGVSFRVPPTARPIAPVGSATRPRRGSPTCARERRAIQRRDSFRGVRGPRRARLVDGHRCHGRTHRRTHPATGCAKPRFDRGCVRTARSRRGNSRSTFLAPTYLPLAAEQWLSTLRPNWAEVRRTLAAYTSNRWRTGT